MATYCLLSLPFSTLPCPHRPSPVPPCGRQAEHEAAVTGLALSPDALRVAIGTENGALGCLHIPDHSYMTLLRSHSATVNAVAVDPNRYGIVPQPTALMLGAGFSGL